VARHAVRAGVWATFSFCSYCLYWSTCCQSSAPRRPVRGQRLVDRDLGDLLDLDVALVLLLEDVLDDVDVRRRPHHEFSLSVTVPHEALFEAALVEAPTRAVAAAAIDSAPSAAQCADAI